MALNALYGQSIKSQAVYLSQFQLIPYERVADYFINEASIPISVGSLFNFNQEAYELLEEFDALAKKKLIQAALVHDHWRPYYTYQNCKQGLCNAHHIKSFNG